WGASQESIAWAPSTVVAVPITRAPSAVRRSAIARPMPRLAPVTSATAFSPKRHLAASPFIIPSRRSNRIPQQGRGLGHTVRLLQGDEMARLEDALVEVGQYPSGSAFEKSLHARR